MTVAVKMPQLGETVVEGTVARWLKAPGDAISRLEPLLEITTDKIDTEVPAPAEGTLLEILIDEGATVRAGEILAYIGQAGEETAIPDHAGTQQDAPGVEAQASDGRESTREAAIESARPARPPQKPSGRDFVSPVVANIAREHAVDLDQISGSGLGGRITKQDILAHLDAAQAVAAPPRSASPQAAEELESELADEVWQPLTTMRRLIAEHMVASKRESPHVTSIFEVDMTQVVRHREGQKAAFAQKGLRLTFTPYFVAAAAHALRRVPQINARFHRENGQQGIVQHRRVHIGIAVALEDGLVVPVIRDADERNLAGLARAVGELAQAAQQRRLAPDAAQGGTFTITNHGVGGSLLGTPIINQPQGAILGIGAIAKRPVVRSRMPSGRASLLPDADDAIVIRPMCYLSLTFDHRLIDGATADAFLTAVKDVLEHWRYEEHNDVVTGNQ